MKTEQLLHTQSDIDKKLLVNGSEPDCQKADGSGTRINDTQVFDAYRRPDYQKAMAMALKVNLPGFWRTQLILAAASGQFGELVAAGNAVQELLKIRPNFAVIARAELKKWYNDELTDHLIEGLRKAGLDVHGIATTLLA